GSHAMFSGRLNGVAPAALAAALAGKPTVSPALEVWIVTHLIGYDVPGVCSLSCAVEEMSASTAADVVPPNTIRLPSMMTCKACSLPPSSIRFGLLGTYR